MNKISFVSQRFSLIYLGHKLISEFFELFSVHWSTRSFLFFRKNNFVNNPIMLIIIFLYNFGQYFIFNRSEFQRIFLALYQIRNPFTFRFTVLGPIIIFFFPFWFVFKLTKLRIEIFASILAVFNVNFFRL